MPLSGLGNSFITNFLSFFFFFKSEMDFIVLNDFFKLLRLLFF